MNKIIVANFKMNVTKNNLTELLAEYNNVAQTTTLLCVPFPYLNMFNNIISNKNIKLCAQNVSNFESGSFTGEVSAKMLADFNVEYCLVGHFERRQNNAENTMQCYQKIVQLLNNNITPILCVGENLKQKQEDASLKTIRKQINGALKKLSKEEINKVIIAYEPVWAIQSQTDFSPQEANDIAYEIKKVLRNLTKSYKKESTVLYGGNITISNYSSYLSQNNINGVLIGKESLNKENLKNILNIK